jgi:hypothetical protein
MRKISHKDDDKGSVSDGDSGDCSGHHNGGNFAAAAADDDDDSDVMVFCALINTICSYLFLCSLT